MKTAGQLAYDAYWHARGETAPRWEDQSLKNQKAWQAAAEVVVNATLDATPGTYRK
jgi:hypothetical protein